MLTNRARCEVEKIESSVEKLVEETHEPQNQPICVVNMHDWVLVHINVFVGSFSLQNRSKSQKITRD